MTCEENYIQAENGMWKKKIRKLLGIEPRSLDCKYVRKGGGGRGVRYWVLHCMPNLLLHSLNNITAVGEHPKTEYELVLQLEGYSPTVKNVQDPEGNVEISYIDYIRNYKKLHHEYLVPCHIDTNDNYA